MQYSRLGFFKWIAWISLKLMNIYVVSRAQTFYSSYCLDSGFGCRTSGIIEICT